MFVERLKFVFSCLMIWFKFLTIYMKSYSVLIFIYIKLIHTITINIYNRIDCSTARHDFHKIHHTFATTRLHFLRHPNTNSGNRHDKYTDSTQYHSDNNLSRVTFILRFRILNDEQHERRDKKQ